MFSLNSKTPTSRSSLVRHWWIFRWRGLQVILLLPLWLGLSLLKGAKAFSKAFSKAFGSEWAARPRNAQAEAAYEEMAESRYQ